MGYPAKITPALQQPARTFAPASKRKTRNRATVTNILNRQPTATGLKPTETPVFMTLSVREAALMLDRDIPKAIDLIKSKAAAYPQGYIGECRDLHDLLTSPAILTLLKALKESNIKTLPLFTRLPTLAVTRTTALLGAISKALQSRNVSTFDYASDDITQLSGRELQFTVHDTLAQIMVKHMPATTREQLESMLPTG